MKYTKCNKILKITSAKGRHFCRVLNMLNDVGDCICIAVTSANITSCNESRNCLCGIRFRKKSIYPSHWIRSCATGSIILNQRILWTMCNSCFKSNNGNTMGPWRITCHIAVGGNANLMTSPYEVDCEFNLRVCHFAMALFVRLNWSCISVKYSFNIFSTDCFLFQYLLINIISYVSFNYILVSRSRAVCTFSFISCSAKVNAFWHICITGVPQWTS